MIRVATLDDVEILVKYNILLAKEAKNINLIKESVKSGAISVLKEKFKGTYYIYEIDKEPIGFTYVIPFWNAAYNKDWWLINNIYLENKYRTKKAINNFFNYLYNLGKDLNIGGIKLFTTDAIISPVYVDNNIWTENIDLKLYEVIFTHFGQI